MRTERFLVRHCPLQYLGSHTNEVMTPLRFQAYPVGLLGLTATDHDIPSTRTVIEPNRGDDLIARFRERYSDFGLGSPGANMHSARAPQ